MYNFDEIVDRQGTACFKYDGRQRVFGRADVLPLWVADMDVLTPPFVLERLRARCQHPVMGYTFRDGAYNKAIVWWYAERHGWAIQGRWIKFCPGVVAGLSHAVRAFTEPGDAVIIQTPVYHPFYSAVTNNGRRLALNPLINRDGHYTMDLEHLAQLAAAGAKMLILCSPHNPVGRVWSREELEALGQVCTRYGLLVVADEIHSDLIFAGHRHVSIAAISDDLAQRTITFGSASKTFNIAGLTCGFAIIPNDGLRKRYAAEMEASGAGSGNLFGFEALKAAYTPAGAEWLDELMAYFAGNVDLVEQTLQSQLPSVRMERPEGTYLLWLDFSAWGLDAERLRHRLVDEALLGLNAGTEFGTEGATYQRMNIACSRATVREALSRLVRVGAPR